ncbi:hypothetical protein GCM10020216_031590 [Nonomuraea helvata]
MGWIGTDHAVRDGTVGTVAAASHWVNTQEQQWTETRQKLIHYNWLVVTDLV